MSLWDIQIDINEAFLDIIKIFQHKLAQHEIWLMVITIWLGVLTLAILYLLSHKVKEL